MSPKDKKVIKSELETLYNSCVEGFTGEWDCSTSEGKEAFQPMADGIQEIANRLGIELEDLKDFDDNPFEDEE